MKDRRQPSDYFSNQTKMTESTFVINEDKGNILNIKKEPEISKDKLEIIEENLMFDYKNFLLLNFIIILVESLKFF